MSGSHTLPPASLFWREDGVLESSRHQDIYYSVQDGLAEKHHVFLNGNGLPDAWRDCSRFVICETGFGTGLNFLVTWKQWAETRQPGQKLDYISAEGFPLETGELQKALACWPGLEVLTHSLLHRLPPRIPGFHRCSLSHDVTLTLLYGAVHDTLPQLDGEVNAWFLDGFAPAVNPDMWTPALYRQMARLSAPRATVATFTVAAAVRKGLTAQGFRISKAPGFGRKKEMLRAVFEGPSPASERPVWFARPRLLAAPTQSPDVLVIGAGLAGLWAAAALRRAGRKVRVLEQGDRPGLGASGNGEALLMPRLALVPGLPGRLYRAAYGYAVDAYTRRGAGVFSPAGVLQYARSAKEAERLMTLYRRQALPSHMLAFLNPEDAAERTQLPLKQPGLYFPQAGIVHTEPLLRELCEDVEVDFGQKVESLHVQHRKNTRLWVAKNPAGGEIAAAPGVILACGSHAHTFETTRWLPLIPTAGQIVHLGVTETSRKLSRPVVFGHYLLPAREGVHIAGASFVKNDTSAQPVPQETQEILTALRRLGLPSFPVRGEGRRSVRAATPDRVPVVGPVPDYEAFLSAYEDLGHGNRFRSYPQAPLHHGLYLLTGLGSRGFLTAPLMAELVAAQITGSPLPLEAELVETVAPARFIIRFLRKRQGISRKSEPG